MYLKKISLSWDKKNNHKSYFIHVLIDNIFNVCHFIFSPSGMTEATYKCWGGYYCPGGMSAPNPTEYLCPRGMQCPNGSDIYKVLSW